MCFKRLRTAVEPFRLKAATGKPRKASVARVNRGSTGLNLRGNCVSSLSFVPKGIPSRRQWFLQQEGLSQQLEQGGHLCDREPVSIQTWGRDQIPEESLAAIQNFVQSPFAVAAALMPDAHGGSGMRLAALKTKPKRLKNFPES